MACGAVLLLFFAPALVFGARYADDIPWHLVWLQSYLDALQQGIWYPRWMPDAVAGMGTPAFYFYPPFATMFFAAVDAVFLRQLPLPYVISVSAFLMGLASAVFFYWWARNFTSLRIAALLGLAYAIAPYHLLTDYYNRGAIGEYAAYLWVPLIFHALYRYARTAHVRWLTLLAVAVMGLFFTHLLTAMMVGPVIAVYVLLLFFRRGDGAAAGVPTVRLFWIAVVAALGVGVAGVYFIPALQLFDAANTAALYARPIEGSRLFGSLSMKAGTGAKYSLFAAAYLGLTAYVVLEYVRARRHGGAAARQPGATVGLWAVAVGLCGLFMWGKLGFVFEAPSPYRSLQFLWRLLMVVEFAFLTLVAVAFARIGAPAARRRMALVFLAVFALMGAYQALALFKKFQHQTLDYNEVVHTAFIKYRLTPPEYYPKGTDFAPRLQDLLVQLKPQLEGAPQAFVVDGAATLTGVAQDRGSFVVRAVVADRAAIAIRQFYFPGWVAKDQAGRSLPVSASTSFKLVTVQVGPGTHTVRVERSVLPSEVLGKQVSIAALALLLLVLTALALLSRRRERAAVTGTGRHAHRAGSAETAGAGNG
ncbi:MAG: hypothetical protein ABW069_02900 [Duganella sp.]